MIYKEPRIQTLVSNLRKPHIHIKNGRWLVRPFGLLGVRSNPAYTKNIMALAFTDRTNTART